MSRSYSCFGPECGASCNTAAQLRRKEIKNVGRSYRRKVRAEVRALIELESQGGEG